jgi:predicted ATPase/DNA-binding winged helix-turn-helix (wHTH) protein
MFGPFRLLVGRRLLLEGERRVQLGSRALEILIALIGRAGEVVEREELIGYVWPNTIVDEANLRVHVAALRKALGDGQQGARYIINTSGRGYSFVAPLEWTKAEPPDPERPTDHPPAHNLPTLLTRMIGRDDALYAIVEQLPRQRLLTIAGPGGIGKTTLALAVAERLLDTYENGVCFVDLAPLADSGLVAGAVASSLGLGSPSVDAIPSLTAFLAEQRRLIVLDTCEHVIEASARLVEELVRSCHGVNFLATSREPLRAEGEHVYRLPALATPMPGGGATAEEAMAFPSVQLFVERASSSLDTFELDDATAPIVSDICRRLDGVPLAIELAAAQIGVFGVPGLAERLSDVPFLSQGRRTAFPRHQTLRAALDWSYELLSEPERKTLRRLAVLSGNFTLQTAIAIAAENEAHAADIIASLAQLVAKSLISADISGPAAYYRLLDVTRSYALAKLDESGEREEVMRRQASYFSDGQDAP